MKRFKLILNAMTKEERLKPDLLDSTRKIEIAKNAEVTVQDINQLMNQFAQMKKMMKQFKGKSMRGMGNMPFGLA